MKAIAWTISLAGWLILVAGCETEGLPPPIVVQPMPSGFEVVTTGSGCREIATGQYVDAAKCAAN